MSRTVLRAALPIAILLVGLGILVLLVKTKPKAKKKPPMQLATLVEVTPVKRSQHPVVVKAHGTVKPARQVVLSTEVSGRVKWVHPALVPGAHFKKGDKLVRIDAHEYVLATQQQQAAVDRARTELELERGRKKIAEAEWKLMGEGTPSEGGLALREPQIRTAEVALKAAQSGLERAKLNVHRTLIRAPFNGTVNTKNVEIRQMVTPSSPLITYVGSDAYWIQASVPVGRLSRIAIPGVGGVTEGAEATITRKTGQEVVTRQGQVIRLLNDLDPVGRMARVLLVVQDPLGLAKHSLQKGASPLPLLLGDYVQVDIAGEGFEGAVEIPRIALREGNQVFVMTKDSTLAIRSVAVVWRERDSALIGSGIEEQDQVIVSPLPAPVEGMRLRTRAHSPAKVNRSAQSPQSEKTAGTAAKPQ